MKLLACVLAVGFAGTSSLFLESAKTTRESQGIEAQMANDGAFRDGLFSWQAEPPCQATDPSSCGSLVHRGRPCFFHAGLSPRFRRQELESIITNGISFVFNSVSDYFGMNPFRRCSL